MAIVAPSLLSCNFLQLQTECEMLNSSKAEWFHVDVMDGVFVPNISFGLPILQQVRTATTKVLDVHLMIVNPDKYIDAFKAAGADVLTVHVEACTHLHRTLQHIKSLGMKAGVAVNPHTNVNQLDDVLADIDVVCLMSVNPGFGGQSFIPNTIQKIKQLRTAINARNLNTLIEIDGGVTIENAPLIMQAGANVLVAGNTVFKSANPTNTIETLYNING
ncbi:MAG: ribulose-phosphate 3-epimerase [Chitinophagaceae bacterium]